MWLTATALAAAAAGVAAAGGHLNELLLIVAIVGGPALLLAARPRWIVLTGLTSTLVEPSLLPTVQSVEDFNLRLGDVLIAAVLLAAVARGERTVPRRLALTTVALIAYGVARSGLLTTGAVSFGRIVVPLVVGLALAKLVSADYNLWADVRLYGWIAVLTAPLFNDSLASRWSGLPGGPNEVSLVSALLVVLAIPMRRASWGRWLTILVGLVGLAGSRSITAVIALAVGLFVVSGYRPEGVKRRAIMSPTTLAILSPSVALVIPILRPDAGETVLAHYQQAQSFGVAFDAVNPIFGSGWAAQAENTLFAFVPVLGQHNVYLDWTIYLGLGGLILLLAWLLVMVHSADRVTTAAVLTVAVWLNTTGAFPGMAWGILGVAMTATLLHREKDTSAPQPPTREAAPREPSIRPREARIAPG